MTPEEVFKWSIVISLSISFISVAVFGVVGLYKLFVEKW